MILEEKLIILRKSQGLSQEDLASKLDVSRQAVYKWETGQAVPEISKLKLLSTLYNVSIDNLLDNSQDIVYMNTPKSRYGTTIVKKELDGDAAEKDNLKLLPEEEKKFKIRKLVLNIAKAVKFGVIALTVLFFVLGCINIDGEDYENYISLTTTFIMITVAVTIVKSILNKVIYPNSQLPRTYFNQEFAKATKQLNDEYDTVLQLQPDLLAWFVYNTKSNSFGFYFDGEIQFYCPINNYASFNVINSYETLVIFELNYFDDKGKLSKYECSLSSFRNYWEFDKKVKSKSDLEFKMIELKNNTKAVVSEIKQRLDIEKSRI